MREIIGIVLFSIVGLALLILLIGLTIVVGYYSSWWITGIIWGLIACLVVGKLLVGDF